jgi:hypothetical protein
LGVAGVARFALLYLELFVMLCWGSYSEYKNFLLPAPSLSTLVHGILRVAGLQGGADLAFGSVLCLYEKYF